MERTERDMLGARKLPAEVLYGIHTARALENFPFTRRPPPRPLIRAYGLVKYSCLQTCAELQCWPKASAKVEAMLRACGEMAEGLLDQHILVDLMQGGAGTSLNMNVNEVLANRALQLLGRLPGDYEQISPLNDINRYQSTNDTFPTALKLAAIYELHRLEQSVVDLGEAFRVKEKEFSYIVKVGRTQYQDAVLTTLGREMGASPKRWRGTAGASTSASSVCGWSTSVLTALVARLGYEECSRIAGELEREQTSVRRIVVDSGRLSEAEFDRLTSSAAVCRLGFVRQEGKSKE